jgi:hypothetical protein
VEEQAAAYLPHNAGTVTRHLQGYTEPPCDSKVVGLFLSSYKVDDRELLNSTNS